MNLCFILSVLKEISRVEVVRISMMNMLNCEFLMLLKYKFQSIQSNVMELSDKPHRMARNL